MSSTGSSSQESSSNRRSRQEPNAWKSVPNASKLLFLACVAVAILIPLVHKSGWLGRRSGSSSAVAGAPAGAAETISAAPGLSLKEANLDLKTRTIKGTVENPTATTYNKVYVSFRVFGTGGTVIGIMEATMADMAGKQSAHFETNPMPAGGKEYDLRELTGTPR
jgi:hypothetical protein